MRGGPGENARWLSGRIFAKKSAYVFVQAHKRSSALASHVSFILKVFLVMYFDKVDANKLNLAHELGVIIFCKTASWKLFFFN